VRSATRHIERPKASGFAAGYRQAAGLSAHAIYEEKPILWVDRIINEFLWSKQREIYDSVTANRYTAVPSAHDTGKSFALSRLAAWWIDTKPDPFVVTTAPTWKQVNSILWREMRKAHRKGSLPGRINLDAEWYVGSDELVGFGRKPADYDQAAFQGIHALNVLVLIDEGCGVPKSLYEAADSLATNRRARVVAIGNPDDPASYFEEICRPASGWNVVQISAFDTPAFTEEEVPDYLYDLLVSPEWVEERKKRWGVHSPVYISKVLGQFPDITDDTLLTPRMIREAQQNEIHPAPFDEPSYGVDPARYGDSRTCVARAFGGYVRIIETTHQQSTMQTANLVAKLLNEEDDFGPNSKVHIDTIGVGGGVYDRCIELGLSVHSYMGSERPYDTDRFFNKRAEDYWHVREMAERGELDLPEQGEDDELIAQLGSIKWKIMPGGKIAIESKEDMRKRDMPSPDRADALVMALAEGLSIFVPNTVREDGSTSETDDLLERDM
jgi:hypothetical protein